MNKLARHCYEEVDLVIFVVDRSKWLKEEKDILNNLMHLNKPVILAINKIDRLEKKEDLLPLIDEIQQKFNLHPFLVSENFTLKTSRNCASFSKMTASFLHPF